MTDDLPYQKHSDTSRDAAKRYKPVASTLRALVEVRIEHSGKHGMTDNELIEAIGKGASSVRPRRVELVKSGIVHDSGIKRERSTVWRHKLHADDREIDGCPW